MPALDHLFVAIKKLCATNRTDLGLLLPIRKTRHMEDMRIMTRNSDQRIFCAVLIEADSTLFHTPFSENWQSFRCRFSENDLQKKFFFTLEMEILTAYLVEKSMKEDQEREKEKREKEKEKREKREDEARKEKKRLQHELKPYLDEERKDWVAEMHSQMTQPPSYGEATKN